VDVQLRSFLTLTLYGG